MNFQEFKTIYKPCPEAAAYIEALGEQDTIKIIELLVKQDKLSWARWGLARCLSVEGRVEWAALCAEAVLPIYEAKYPNDNRPRLAIEAARSLDAAAAYAAANAANAAAHAAAHAACTAADAAYAAANAAHAAANAAHAAANAAHAADAAYAALPKIRKSLIYVGLEILKAERGIE